MGLFFGPSCRICFFSNNNNIYKGQKITNKKANLRKNNTISKT